MPVTLTATQVPKPTAASSFYKLVNGTTITAKTFTTGETSTVPGKLNSNSVQLDNAFRYGSGSNGVCYGLNVTAGTGLTITVSSGHAIAGTFVELASDATIAVPASSARVHVWIDSAGAVSVVNNSLTPPAGTVTYLGSCVTDTSSVLSTDTTGVCYLRNGVMWRQTADTGVPGDTPSTGMVFFTQTSNGVYFWDGTYYRALVPSSVINSSGTANLGFYGATPVAKTTVADPAALTSPTTISGSYTQSEVQKLRDDIAALRTTLAAAVDALQSYGLI